jgi:hypothetical protein
MAGKDRATDNGPRNPSGLPNIRRPLKFLEPRSPKTLWLEVSCALCRNPACRSEGPNLLLKGSGRVNRFLGSEEDLTDVLAKSLRQAKRQREQ